MGQVVLSEEENFLKFLYSAISHQFFSFIPGLKLLSYDPVDVTPNNMIRRVNTSEEIAHQDLVFFSGMTLDRELLSTNDNTNTAVHSVRFFGPDTSVRDVMAKLSPLVNHELISSKADGANVLDNKLHMDTNFKSKYVIPSYYHGFEILDDLDFEVSNFLDMESSNFTSIVGNWTDAASRVYPHYGDSSVHVTKYPAYRGKQKSVPSRVMVANKGREYINPPYNYVRR